MDRKEESAGRFTQIWNQVGGKTEEKKESGPKAPVQQASRIKEKKSTHPPHHGDQAIGPGLASDRTSPKKKVQKENVSQDVPADQIANGTRSPAKSGREAAPEEDQTNPNKPPPDPNTGKTVGEDQTVFTGPNAMMLSACIEKGPPSSDIQGQSQKEVSQVEGLDSHPSQPKGDLVVTKSTNESAKTIVPTLKALVVPVDSGNNPLRPQAADSGGTGETDPVSFPSQLKETDLTLGGLKREPTLGKKVLPSSEKKGIEPLENVGGRERTVSAFSTLRKGEEEALGERNQTPPDVIPNDKAQISFSDSPLFNILETVKDAAPASSGQLNQPQRSGEILSSNTIPEGQKVIQQIAEKLSMGEAKEGRSIRLRLEPEALGSLRIEISMRGREVSAEIVTKHLFVKEILDGNQAALRQTLSEYGFKVDRFAVNVGEPGGHFPDFQRSPWNKAADPFAPAEPAVISLSGTGLGPLHRGSIGGGISRINLYI